MKVGQEKEGKRGMETQEKIVEKERETEREEKTSLAGYLYMHLWGPILSSNILS